MRSVRSLSSGLLIGLIVAVTVFGALILSVHSPANLLAELPIPTITLDLGFVTPTPTATSNALPSATPAISPTPTTTPSPTPTACPLPADWQRYIVGPFDTLAFIAQRFNLSPEQLARANCLAQPNVTVGQALYVPGFRPTPTVVPCYPPFNWAVYVVQPGDTLSAIARRYGISLYMLMRGNCLTTAYIYAGQRLFVPPTFPILTFTPTPIVPMFTLTPPIVSLTPTATPVDISLTPPITFTPGPTGTPGPTVTPGPTDTPGATATPGPSATPVPTETSTPIVTVTPGATDTPAPTATVAPDATDTPAPTVTVAPVPTNTPAPADTLAPLATLEPTNPPPNTPEPQPSTTP